MLVVYLIFRHPSFALKTKPKKNLSFFMAYRDVSNCTSGICLYKNGVTILAEPLKHTPPQSHLFMTLVTTVGVLLSAVVVVSLCLYFGRTKLLLFLRKRKLVRAEEKELINFIVPSIKVTEVYVTRPSHQKHHQSSSKTKLQVSRQYSVSSLSVDDALSDATYTTPAMSDDDRDYLQINPHHVSSRTLSRSHGDLLDAGPGSSSECSSTGGGTDDLCRLYTMERFDIRPDELNTAQYAQSGTVLHSTDTYTSCEHGKICFSVAYNDRTEVLTVVVRKVVNLSPRPARVFADPYVKLTLLPDKSIKYVTNVHQRTLDPVFCQTFLFPVNKDELKSKSLKLTVCDHLKFFRRNVLGYTVFSLEELGSPPIFTTHHEIWRALTDDLTSKGMLGFQGEILVGIKMEQQFNLFTLSILQLKDVILSDSEKEHGGVKIKATIMVGQQLLKCKRTKQKKFPHDNNIVFNQDIKTQVPADCINKLNVSISVLVNHAFSKTRLVGRTYIGPYYYASGSGLRHWINMLACPTQLSTMWHKLK